MYILLGVIALTGLMTGTAYAESIKYNGNNIPLNFEVYGNDVLTFTGSDRVSDMNFKYPKSNTFAGCDNIGVGGTCIIDFSDWTLGQHEYTTKGTAQNGKITVVAGINYADVSDSAKNFKGKIEELIAKKLAPLELQIVDLKNEITMYEENIAIVKAKLVKAEADSSEATEKLLVVNNEKLELQQQVGLAEQYKKDASNWRAVALEQLKVMAEVLGLF